MGRNPTFNFSSRTSEKGRFQKLAPPLGAWDQSQKSSDGCGTTWSGRPYM
jgi:hypothetical protein